MAVSARAGMEVAQRWCRHAPVLEAALAADVARSIRCDDAAALGRCQEALRQLHGHAPTAA